jgi:hypothetical protein
MSPERHESATARKPFSLDSLDAFMRPGATIEKRDEAPHAGCWVTLANGWVLSIQWGSGTYGDNYHGPWDTPPQDSNTAEIACWHTDEGRQGMIAWGTSSYGETVQGYVPMERVQRVLDLLDSGELIQSYTPPPEPPPEPELRAVDGWEDDDEADS